MIILSLILLGILALSVATAKVDGDAKNVFTAKLLSLIMLGVPFGTLLAQLF